LWVACLFYFALSLTLISSQPIRTRLYLLGDDIFIIVDGEGGFNSVSLHVWLQLIGDEGDKKSN